MVKLIFIGYFGDGESDLLVTFSVGKIFCLINYVYFSILNWTLDICLICRLLEFSDSHSWVMLFYWGNFNWGILMYIYFTGVTLIGEFWCIFFLRIYPITVILFLTCFMKNDRVKLNVLSCYKYCLANKLDIFLFLPFDAQ